LPGTRITDEGGFVASLTSSLGLEPSRALDTVVHPT